MRVVAIVLAHHLPEEAVPWIQGALEVLDDLRIVIDEQRATEGMFDRAEKLGAKVFSQ
jgi:hypothetical protein